MVFSALGRFCTDVDFFLRVTEAFLGSQQSRGQGARWPLESPLNFAERSKMKLGLLRKSERESQEFQGGKGVPRDRKRLWLYGILLMTTLKIHFKK